MLIFRLLATLACIGIGLPALADLPKRKAHLTNIESGLKTSKLTVQEKGPGGDVTRRLMLNFAFDDDFRHIFYDYNGSDLLRCEFGAINMAEDTFHTFIDEGCDGTDLIDVISDVGKKDDKTVPFIKRPVGDEEYLKLLKEFSMYATTAGNAVVGRAKPEMRLTGDTKSREISAFIMRTLVTAAAERQGTTSGLIALKAYAPPSYGLVLFADKNGKKMSRCQIVSVKPGSTAKATWVDDACDGQFEWEDPKGTGKVTRHRDQGVFTQKMILSMLIEIAGFMPPYYESAY